MSRLIDCSIPDVLTCDVSQTLAGKLKFRLAYGWNAHEYRQEDIATLSLIDEEKYRSAGGAAAGAIIGGVLTGGIGLIAGAALGGRQQGRAAFVVVFKDGHHVAFEEGRKANITALARIIQSGKARAIATPQNHEDASDVSEAPSPTAAPRAAPPVLEKKKPPFVSIAFWALVALVGIGTWWGLREDDHGVAVLMAGMAVIPLLAMGLVVLLLGKLVSGIRRK